MKKTGSFVLNQFNKQISYLLGAYLGDGCVYTNKNGWKQFTLEVIDKDFAEKTQACLNKLVGVDNDIYLTNNRRTGKESFKAYSGNQELCKYLEDITGKKSYFPQEIYYCDNSLKQEFLSGLFDAEGWVDNYGGYLKIGIASTSVWILELVDLLNSLGSNISKISRMKNSGVKPLWKIIIPTRDIKKIGLFFSIKRKQDRIDTYFQSPQTERVISLIG